MKVLFIEAPSRERNTAPPYGILYAAGTVLRCNHRAKIIDYSNRAFSFEHLGKEVKEYRPDLIGLGGITPSYRNLKKYTYFLKSNFPQIPLIVGGVISCIEELLLKKAKVDLVVRSEAETTIPYLMGYYEGELKINAIPGISYLKDGEVVRNDPVAQVSALDEIPFPPYELLDIDKYLYPTRQWIDFYFKYHPQQKTEVLQRLKNAPYMLPIMTARGCTNKCIFCYRHLKGIRQHSVSYVIEHIKYLKKNYGVGFFQISDELTTVDSKWILNFCDSLERQQLNINFVVMGARVDKINEEMVRRLKETGCVMVNYGYESGSDTILKEIGKGTTREQNIQAALINKKMGLLNVPEIMIGFPNENENTVAETISFLKVIGQYPVSVNYVLPFPKTPLWRHCLDKGIIRDEEGFILDYGEAAHFKVNLTSFPDKVVKSWWVRVVYEATRQNCLKNHDYLRLAKFTIWRHLRHRRIWDYLSLVRESL